MELAQFLQWLIGSGGAVMAASWILEQIPQWMQWENSAGKKWSFFGLSAAIGSAALAVIQYAPAAALEAIAPYFAVLAAAFATIFMGEAFHKLTKKD